jgi:GT2 family glycosyltransferase
MLAGPLTSYTPGPQQISRACHCRHYWSDGQISSFAEKHVTGNRDEALVDVSFVGGFAFFIRRSAWDELDGFDKNLPDYGNEKEFCRRVIQEGFRIVFSRESYIHHLGSESYGKTLGFSSIRKRSVEADSYMREKHGSEQ